MGWRNYARNVRNRLRLAALTVREPNKERFECPVCGYCGPFLDVSPPWGFRRHAECPSCNALERHRLQFLVVNRLLVASDTSKLRMLHVAPEPCFRHLFSQKFGRYESADLNMVDVDHNVDLLKLPFPDNSYDFVFASHVLEHIRDDEGAIAELRRILKPNGIAILPVPIVAEKTIEYPAPSPREGYHVRAPGLDYFDKYERYFSRVDRVTSEELPNKYQPFVYENRTVYPTAACPWRPPMAGERHVDVVPVCYA